MRFVSYLRDGTQTLGVLADDDHVVAVADLSSRLPATMAELIATPQALAAIEQLIGDGPAPAGTAIGELSLLAPLPHPGNIVCIGQNYREHAAEQDKQTPPEPAIFLKKTSSITGHGSDIIWDPDYATQVDYEAELAVIIGTTASKVSQQEALSHVFGYSCLNDVTARDLQFGDLQWARGKSLDTFCPMGPALVTADEIDDPQQLDVRCLLNGEVVQQANTADMYHSVAKIISYCSQAFTLHPGDVIATGTPGGVGIFREPPLLLGDKDETVVDIAKVGRLANQCVARKD